MKQIGKFLCRITYGLTIISVFNSCAVVKTPYFKTNYYKETISRLDSLKSGIIIENDSLYAGFARVSITPELISTTENPENGQFNNVPIAGYGQLKQKLAEGVHDSIFVKAVAIKSGKDTIVIIGADMLIMPPNITDSVTSSLSKAGLRRTQLFFSATHTHSSIGGWGYGLLAKLIAGKESTHIENWLTVQIKKAVLIALSDLHPARLGSGSFKASPYTRNRLTGNPDEQNDDFNYIVIEQTRRKKAIIGSFSAHATTIGRKNVLISGDYPGFWERKTEAGAADLAIFCGGSMGSQSPVGQGSEFENAKFIGEALADSLSSDLKKITFNYRPDISTLSLKMLLPEYHIRMTTNRNLTTRLSNRIMPLPKNVYLQELKINNLIWFFTPGDFSGESALQIKNSLAGKGYDAMISGYNGSYVGYIMPGKYFYLDHYETKGMGWFGPTMGDYTMDLIDQMSNAIISNK